METIKFNFTYNKSAKDLLEFINKTQEGCYSKDKPIITDIKYRRVNVQENSDSFIEASQDEILLFGITY